MNHKTQQIGQKLVDWYQRYQRPLPWRKNPTPYHILISEFMLQQTRVQTVIPYYERFIKKFPDLRSLASSSFEKVLPYWSGLGYYSRIKNLHHSVKAFVKECKAQIPKTAKELSIYPGFGPYTSKAISSQAFGERVSVLDGNVIRVLCRHENLFVEWWRNQEKVKLENIASQWSVGFKPQQINQAFMELGATVCTPQSPLCSICPIQTTCKARKKKTVSTLPIHRLKRKTEIWLWKPTIQKKGKKVFLTKNHQCPFLKNQYLFSGVIQKVSIKPDQYDIRHSITHHQIFVQLNSSVNQLETQGKWIDLSKVSTISPSSLVKKILHRLELLKP